MAGGIEVGDTAHTLLNSPLARPYGRGTRADGSGAGLGDDSQCDGRAV